MFQMNGKNVSFGLFLLGLLASIITGVIGSTVIYYYFEWYFQKIFNLNPISFKESVAIFIFIVFIKRNLNKEDYEDQPILNPYIDYGVFYLIILSIGYLLK